MTSPLIIEFYRTKVYGQETLYVKDPEMAAKVSRITGTKTLLKRDMENITDLFGTQFKEVLPV